jgi:preprotein translocase subunit SecD
MTVPPGNRDTETRLIAALTDTARRNLPDGTAPPPFRQPAGGYRSPSRRSWWLRSWALPALAAAVVVAVTVSAVALANRGRPATHRVPGGTTSGLFVTLRARTHLSAAELDRAKQVISARAVALGAQGGEVRVVGSKEITATLPGLTPSDVTDLGAVGDLQLRPLVIGALGSPTSQPAGPTATTGGARRTVNPFSSLGFPPPTDTAAWRALSSDQQNAVQDMLKGWDCADAAPDQADAPTVLCELGGGWKYLLGPAIVTSKDVRSTTVTPYPGPAGWQLSVNLKAAAQQRWNSYTAQHNEQTNPHDPSNIWVPTVDGNVVQSHMTRKPVNGAPAIWYTPDQRSETRLAANLTGGVLPAPFDVVVVRAK